jgi:hypothetical protein
MSLSRIADQMSAEWDRIGKLSRDIEASDWEHFDALSEQLWATPSRSISDLAAKARVTNLYREGCERSEEWRLVDDILAMGRGRLTPANQSA